MVMEHTIDNIQKYNKEVQKERIKNALLEQQIQKKRQKALEFVMQNKDDFNR